MEGLKQNWAVILGTILLTLLVLADLGYFESITAPFNLNAYQDPNTMAVTIDTPTDYLPHNAQSWAQVNAVIMYGEYQTLILNWQGYGGMIQYSAETIGAIEFAKTRGKKVIINLVGDAYSASAIVPCYATEVKYNDHFLMFHEIEIHGKVADKDHRFNHIDFDMCVAKGILTNEQVTTMDAGNEIYIYSKHSEIRPDPRERA